MDLFFVKNFTDSTLFCDKVLYRENKKTSFLQKVITNVSFVNPIKSNDSRKNNDNNKNYLAILT